MTLLPHVPSASPVPRSLFLQFFARLCIAALLCVPIVSASAAPASELMDRQVIGAEVATLFHTGNFRELDRISKQYLENSDRTSSGLWKLTLFYAGIESIPNDSVADEKYWNDLESNALKWATSRPKSPTGHLAYATFLKAHAWMYRGGGYSNDVRSEDWEPFYNYIAKTRSYLEAHKTVASKDPYWYQLMIEVATAEGWSLGDFDALVDEATSRYPYYYQIYFNAINFLTPKWHGSRDEIERFARKAVRLTRDKEGESMYARVYWVASQANYGNRLFTDSAVVWASMSKSIDDVMQRYPDQWNTNNFAHFACLAGDAPKAKQLISKIKGKPITEAWGSISEFNACQRWATAQDKKQIENLPAAGVRL